MMQNHRLVQVTVAPKFELCRKRIDGLSMHDYVTS